MDKEQNYKLVVRYNLISLEEEVNHLIGLGYQPYGSPIITNVNTYSTVYAQAMMKS